MQFSRHAFLIKKIYIHIHNITYILIQYNKCISDSKFQLNYKAKHSREQNQTNIEVKEPIAKTKTKKIQKLF